MNFDFVIEKYGNDSLHYIELTSGFSFQASLSKLTSKRCQLFYFYIAIIFFFICSYIMNFTKL